ncbi:hypothetical protein PFICI_04941 [Pestalotiopsis fici W106-1]|uniref:Beta-galactosidase n=1 Tax=Pestalotiopsis fici (strain W106-1 / CGMCC3.15140) TaxID=1229662 RepID=W3XAI5_PESFW|nr:uncharacterized protein PFICI_04941 [Pestalotiopsis fici W106-1]ETS83065.1 hypothetical protein PFICI_04941 [Pestalotiopsis fici W106-1]
MHAKHPSFLSLFLGSTILAGLNQNFGSASAVPRADTSGRNRTRLHEGWKFQLWPKAPDGITYDLRPDNTGQDLEVLKPWILPSANAFIPNETDHYSQPVGQPETVIPYVSPSFNDSSWSDVEVPHDWAITEAFVSRSITSGDMGRLQVQGVGWYRRPLEISTSDRGKHIYLEVDGAMSYAMVWLNGQLVGGWPYGYNSFRMDLTPYIDFSGDTNNLAIRVENPQDDSFSRWYPGAGIYRNVWLEKVNSAVHVAQYGTTFVSSEVSSKSATLDLSVRISNKASNETSNITVITEVHNFDSPSGSVGRMVATFPARSQSISPGATVQVNSTITISKPYLWGPPPLQHPNMYMAYTRLYNDGDLLDTYTSTFGIRTIDFDPNNGLHVNGQKVFIQGVNQHHDLGALGTAFNVRAATRQLQILQELGVNTIRLSHNPPAPELLKLTDELGCLVLDEIFDNWAEGKRDSDFSLIWQDWHEADLRAFVRRDRNHPSIFLWSFGNEVLEASDDKELAGQIAANLTNIVTMEDPSRPSTASIFRSVPGEAFPNALKVLGINYLGEGARYGEAYVNLTGYRTDPLYEPFHNEYPERMIFGSEVAASASSRGTFTFPVTQYDSCPIDDSHGGNSTTSTISGYEIYTADSGSSPDRVFKTQDEYPFVAGGIVWSGFDYLGEPVPYRTSARSSYYGIIDLAGFKKERFFLYQSRWRPDLPMAHIVPHWNWPERDGQVTPVHVFTSGDEAELFINGKSQGRKKRGAFEYRFRWDDTIYTAGNVSVITYKNGTRWAEDIKKTTGKPAALQLTADRATIIADGEDLSFVTVTVLDSNGDTVPEAANKITFSVEGQGRIVATDNGLPTDMTRFTSLSRNTFSGLALAVVEGLSGLPGKIVLTAKADGLTSANITITTT